MSKLTKEIYESEKTRVLNDERYTPAIRDWLLSEIESRWKDEQAFMARQEIENEQTQRAA